MELNDGLLDKVRALLAKAEATPFDAEAEAFTNKAQELIARYRIDRALLDRANAREREPPILRRVGVETPYVRAKYVLLSRIAEANHCQTVWLVPLPVVDVFGLAEDLVVVEELFTSLLLQVTTAMRRAGAKQNAYGGSRTTAFRRAFLLSFAVRIGQRLQETVDATVDAATAATGVALVPIFKERAEAAQELAREAHPFTSPMRASVSSAEGWRAGTAFANQVDLSRSGALTER
jgi:hypothetical protein